MKKIALFSLVLSLVFATSCDVLKQVSEMATLSRCEFRLESVNNLNLAGVNVQNVKKISDLNLTDYARLGAAVATQQFPLDFTLNLQGKNPNAGVASMVKVDWILQIDGIEMNRGSLNDHLSIPANNGTAILPINFHFDLKQVLSGKSADAILNFGLNLAGAGNKPTRFTLQMKPTITVGGFPITYPGYINVNTEFTGK